MVVVPRSPTVTVIVEMVDVITSEGMEAALSRDHAATQARASLSPAPLKSKPTSRTPREARRGSSASRSPATDVQLTCSVPCIELWILQWYAIVPALVSVTAFDLPGDTVPALNEAWSAVNV